MALPPCGWKVCILQHILPTCLLNLLHPPFLLTHHIHPLHPPYSPTLTHPPTHSTHPIHSSYPPHPFDPPTLSTPHLCRHLQIHSPTLPTHPTLSNPPYQPILLTHPIHPPSLQAPANPLTHPTHSPHPLDPPTLSISAGTCKSRFHLEVLTAEESTPAALEQALQLPAPAPAPAQASINPLSAAASSPADGSSVEPALEDVTNEEIEGYQKRLEKAKKKGDDAAAIKAETKLKVCHHHSSRTFTVVSLHRTLSSSSIIISRSSYCH